MAEYRAIARPDPDDSKPHPCNRLRPKRLRRKTPAKLLDVLLLRQRSGGVRLEQAVSRLRALRIARMQRTDLLAPEPRALRVAIERRDRRRPAGRSAIAELIGIAAREVGVVIRLVLSIRPNRTICPLGKVTVRLAHRVSTIRLVLVHFKAPAPVPVHPTDTRAQLDPNGLLAPPLRRCRRGNRAAEHQDPRRRGRIRTAG